MKQNDIALIVIVVFISAVSSFFISNKFIGSTKHDLKVAKVDPINDEFKEPASKYFNEKSINPTQIIRVDNFENPNPIKAQQ